MDLMQLNLKCATCSELVYSVKSSGQDGVEFGVTEHQGSLIIAVRGTELSSFRDIMRNLRIIPTGAGKYCYHSGFWNASKLIFEPIQRHLQLFRTHPIQQRRVPLVFTGHSQGAGIALCLARRFEKAGYNVSYCIGFGSPKTMSQINHKECGFAYHHFRFGRDIVPSYLPLGIFYTHVRPPIKLGVPSSAFPNWKDHGISRYRQELSNQLDRAAKLK